MGNLFYEHLEKQSDGTYIKEIRNKAIDEFARALKDEYPYFVESFGCAVNKAFHKKIDEIAEQLKEDT